MLDSTSGSPGRFPFSSPRTRIRRPLRATVQAYTSNGDSDETGSPKKADFPRDHVPSHETLQSWVESQIRREHKPDFPQALQSFLLAYFEGGRSLPKVRKPFLEPLPVG